MDNIKDDTYYLEKMKTNFERIKHVMKNTSYDDYINNLDLQEITMFNLIQISENVNKISLNFKNSNNSIPWSDIYGLRNRIVHDYGNVVLDVVYQTLRKDIPDLYKKLYK